MAPKIAAILMILSDGSWHTLEEIRKKTRLSIDQVKRIADFLARYGFVARDVTEEKIRIEEAFREFLAQEATL